jgi:hydroxymethylbilane synthase
MQKLIFATRPSQLARWQTNHIIQSLKKELPELVCEEAVITTQGDKVLDRPLPEIGGKGLFTEELEAELLSGRVDVAVHSLKDLPVENPPGLTLGLIPERVDTRDVLVSGNGYTIDSLPEGAIVGTSSLRRQGQILAQRPDLNIRSIRGNVDTRIRKVVDGEYDAAILAAAGIIRLGLEEHISQWVPSEIILPAPGQGALGVQCRTGDKRVIDILSVLTSPDTKKSVTTERAFLLALGGGCSIPVGAFAKVSEGMISMKGVVSSVDGKTIINVEGSGTDPFELAEKLAKEALSLGALEVINA